MSMTADEAPLLTRIHAARTLSGGHRRLGDCLIRNAHEAAFWGIEELAKRAEVSVSAVVRFAKKLGYSGYTELRGDLVAAAKVRSLGEDRLLDAPKGAAATLVDVARRDIANIERTVHSINDKLLSGVVKALTGARHRVLVGHGISQIMAQHLGYVLTITGLVTVAGNPAEFARQTVNLTPEDLLVAISFPPYSLETVRVVEFARRQQVPVIAITDRLDSPLARHAQFVLPVPGENLLFSHSLAGFNVLIHTIATAVASRDPELALRRLREAERIAAPILLED
jgi:DNA-binding MurR/RpiR family transcriptional regulator